MMHLQKFQRLEREALLMQEFQKLMIVVVLK
jgi:hypothetical protein